MINPCDVGIVHPTNRYHSVVDTDLVRPIVGRQTLAQERAFSVQSLTIRGEHGDSYTRTILKHHGAVVVLPIREAEGGPVVVTVRNERHTIEGWLEELPAGGIERGESPEAAAARELREETGYEASELIPLGRFYTTPGLTDELMWAFVARGLKASSQDLDEDEVLTVHERPVADFVAAVDRVEMLDAKTLLTVLLARSRGLIG